MADDDVWAHHELDWELIAQAEGMLSVQRDITIDAAADVLRVEARALGVPVGRLAEDLVDRKPALPAVEPSSPTARRPSPDPVPVAADRPRVRAVRP